MQKIVRSIDVGYGQTKFIKDSKNLESICELFPSEAPTVNGTVLQDPLLNQTDIIKIDLGGVTRVMGKDALHFQSAFSLL